MKLFLIITLFLLANAAQRHNSNKANDPQAKESKPQHSDEKTQIEFQMKLGPEKAKQHNTRASASESSDATQKHYSIKANAPNLKANQGKAQYSEADKEKYKLGPPELSKKPSSGTVPQQCTQPFYIQNSDTKTYLKWAGSTSRFIMHTTDTDDAIQFRFCDHPCKEKGWKNGKIYLKGNDPANRNYYYWLTYGKAAGTDQDYLMSIFDNNCSMWENHPVEFGSLPITGSKKVKKVKLLINSWKWERRYGRTGICCDPEWFDDFGFLEYSEDYAYFESNTKCTGGLGYPTDKDCKGLGDYWTFLSTDATNTDITHKVMPPSAKNWTYDSRRSLGATNFTTTLSVLLPAFSVLIFFI